MRISLALCHHSRMDKDKMKSVPLLGTLASHAFIVKYYNMERIPFLIFPLISTLLQPGLMLSKIPPDISHAPQCSHFRDIEYTSVSKHCRLNMHRSLYYHDVEHAGCWWFIIRQKRPPQIFTVGHSLNCLASPIRIVAISATLHLSNNTSHNYILFVCRNHSPYARRISWWLLPGKRSAFKR